MDVSEGDADAGDVQRGLGEQLQQAGDDPAQRGQLGAEVEGAQSVADGLNSGDSLLDFLGPVKPLMLQLAVAEPPEGLQ